MSEDLNDFKVKIDLLFVEYKCKGKYTGGMRPFYEQVYKTYISRPEFDSKLKQIGYNPDKLHLSSRE